MRNNLQNDVKIENAKNFISKFNLSGSYSSTASVGEVTCKFSRLLQPGTKAMCGEESLVFLAPLVAPTYAKQHYKTWHNFIPVEDVWPNYSAFMTQQTISRNGQIIQPTLEPCIPKDGLSLFVLNGAKGTLYARQLPDTFNIADVETLDMESFISGGYFDFPSSLNVVSGTSEYSKLYRKAVNRFWFLRSDGTPVFNYGKLARCTLDAPIEMGGASDLELESGNMTLETFRREDVDVGQSLWYGYDLTTNVSMDKSDINIYSVIENGDGLDHSYIVCFAFRLSSWGIRLFKTLRGLGYGIDVDAIDEIRSILPLLATYKAYWDVFGLNLWQNFESTYCGRLISYLQQTNSTNVWTNSTAWNLFKPFMMTEFGAMWLTEKNDYISAHLPQPVVSANNITPLQGVVDAMPVESGTSSPSRVIEITSNANPVSGQPTTGREDGHAYINVIQHGYLDSEILKRLYKRTNANTALGKKIADLMRSQGLGTYMERTRVNYIGDTDVILDVQSVISQADTFKSANGSREGAMLGQRGGRGVGYKKNDKKLYYKTDCLGYWICLESITCDSGWSQSEDVTLSALRQHEKYQADYENLGLSLSPKSIINGSRNEGFGGVIYNGSKRRNLSMSSQPFGFAPRMTPYKVGRSCMSGGFALRSMRDTYLGYNMDKVVLPDEFYNQDVTSLNVNTISGPTGCKKFIHMIGFKTKDVPTAGNPYRFLGRWPWMGNLLRIFAYEGTGEGYAHWLSSDNYEDLARVWEYHYRTEDNYILLGEIWFKAWSPMVPIEETYGTVDSDKKELEYVERV